MHKIQLVKGLSAKQRELFYLGLGVLKDLPSMKKDLPYILMLEKDLLNQL